MSHFTVCITHRYTFTYVNVRMKLGYKHDAVDQGDEERERRRNCLSGANELRLICEGKHLPQIASTITTEVMAQHWPLSLITGRVSDQETLV